MLPTLLILSIMLIAWRIEGSEVEKQEAEQQEPEARNEDLDISYSVDNIEDYSEQKAAFDISKKMSV